MRGIREEKNVEEKGAGNGFPSNLGSILYTAGNSRYGRVESGGCWPLFPLQALVLSGVGQAVDLGLAFQAAKEKNGDYHKTEPLTWTKM